MPIDFRDADIFPLGYTNVMFDNHANPDNIQNNIGPFQAAINGVAEGGVVWAPTGGMQYRFTTAGAGGSALNATKSVTIQGGDKYKTILEFGPSDQSGVLTGITVSEGKRLVLRDLTLKAPATDNPQSFSNAILAGTLGQNTSCIVECYDCIFDGWGTSIKFQASNGFTNTPLLIMERCIDTFNGLGDNVLMPYGGTVLIDGCTFDQQMNLFLSANATATATGTVFTDTTSGMTFTGDTVTGSSFIRNVSRYSINDGGTKISLGDTITGVGIPVATTVSQQPNHNLYLYESVNFDIVKTTFLNAGGYNVHNFGGVVGAKYAHLIGCNFSGKPGSGAILPNSIITTDIDSCTFNNTTGADLNLREGDVNISNCDFVNTGPIQVLGGHTAPTLKATSSYFTCQINRNITGQPWEFSACHFKIGKDAISIAVGASGGVEVSNCVIENGSKTTDGIISVSIGTLTVQNCRLLNGDAGSSLKAIVASGTGSFRSVNNTFQDETNGTSSTSSVRSALKPRPGIGTDIVAASTIIVGLNFDTYNVVAGTTATDSIKAQGTAAALNAIDIGPYQLISKSSTANLTAAGNISVAQALTLGKVFSVVRDGTADKWYTS